MFLIFLNWALKSNPSAVISYIGIPNLKIRKTVADNRWLLWASLFFTFWEYTAKTERFLSNKHFKVYKWRRPKIYLPAFFLSEDHTSLPETVPADSDSTCALLLKENESSFSIRCMAFWTLSNHSSNAWISLADTAATQAPKCWGCKERWWRAEKSLSTTRRTGNSATNNSLLTPGMSAWFRWSTPFNFTQESLKKNSFKPKWPKFVVRALPVFVHFCKKTTSFK